MIEPAAKGIPEDPVTGGAHCGLAPYWAKRLDKTGFRALLGLRVSLPTRGRYHPSSPRSGSTHGISL